MKNFSNATTCLLFCFLLSGCVFFGMAGQKISQYCPGLTIKVDGFNWHENGRRSVLICDYDTSHQKNVKAYFADPANNYTTAVGRTYYAANIRQGLVDAIDTTTVGKIITKGKDSTWVYFDGTRGRIIIIEQKAK